MKFNIYSILLTFSLTLLLTKFVIAQNITTDDGYLEYGIGRFEYDSTNWGINTTSTFDSETFIFSLMNNDLYNMKSISGSFLVYSYNFPTLEEKVADSYEDNVEDSGAENEQYEYFETSHGYPAGISYHEKTTAGFTSKTGQLWIDLTETSDADSMVLFSGTFTGSSIQEIKSAANGVKRYQGTPIVSDPDNNSGSSDEGDSIGDNSDVPENSIPVEDTLICDFQDGPISICFPQNTVTDFYQSYSENGLMTQAYYSAYINNSYIPTNINLYTEPVYEKLDDWAAHQTDTWQKSEFNPNVTTKSFTTDHGFKGHYVIRDYDSTFQNDVFEYFIVVDLSTNAWKQRYSLNEYKNDDAWLRFQITGIGQTLTQNYFSESLAIAMSVNYDETISPNIPEPVDSGNYSPITSALGKNFSDGPLNFDIPISTVTDFYQSYSENGLMTQAYYSAYINNSYIPTNINLYTEPVYEKLDDWAAHQTDTWQKSEFNPNVTTKSFTTDHGFKGHYVIRDYNSTFQNDVFEYFIVVDLSTDAWKQRYSLNEYKNDDAWLRFQITGIGQTLTQNYFSESLAIAMSLNYDETISPNIPEPVENHIDLSASIGLSVSSLESGWFFSDWLGTFFDPGSGWIFHEHLEWIYWNNSVHGSWIWAEGKDWLWTSEEAFPHMYSENTKDWVYLSFSEQDLPKAYDFSNESWSDWSNLVLNKTNTPTTQNSSGEEAKAIEEIYYSDSMSEEEKIDAIGSIILFGL
jgi:hypothetical protein